MNDLYRSPDKWTPQGFSKYVGLHGFKLTEDGDGVSVSLDVDDHHLNIGGIVHGGVLLAMLDSAMGGAVVTHLQDGEWASTMSLTTNFMRPGEAGTLVATGRLARRGKLTAFVDGEVKNADGDVIASATGVWAIRRG